MKKSLFNFAATMLMSAGAVVFNACSDDNTDSDGGVGTLEVTPASLETIADYAVVSRSMFGATPIGMSPWRMPTNCRWIGRLPISFPAWEMRRSISR